LTSSSLKHVFSKIMPMGAYGRVSDQDDLKEGLLQPSTSGCGNSRQVYVLEAAILRTHSLQDGLTLASSMPTIVYHRDAPADGPVHTTHLASNYCVDGPVMCVIEPT
jgi:hypothetical protein